MAFSATFYTSSSPSFAVHCRTRRPIFLQNGYFAKSLTVKASTTVDFSKLSQNDKSSPPTKTNSWQWKFKENLINIYYEEHEGKTSGPSKNILMVPTISDVSTVEEWRSVARDIVQRDGGANWRATILDWPGLGYSDRPKIDYNADVMEKFLVDFINQPDSPISCTVFFNCVMARGGASNNNNNGGNCTNTNRFTNEDRSASNDSNSPYYLSNGDHPSLALVSQPLIENDLVVFGGGHGATLAVRAAKKGLLKPIAIAAVAPTWAGPLPIVFGRDSNMESRYGLLRGTLRAPAVGWMMYNMLVSNEKSIESQYKSHVYANPENVTRDIIESRYALTKQKGARYAPAAFLTGLLDPVQSREEFLELFADMEGKIPVVVVSTKGSPKRSKAEMEALRGAKGVSKFVELPGALLPQEEYPDIVAEELHQFLQENS